MGQESEELTQRRQDLRNPAEFQQEDAQELHRDIDHTREDMSRTLDAIGDRVSPQRMYQRRTAPVRQGFRNFRNSVMGASDARASSLASRTGDAPQQIQHRTRGNPLAAGLIAFGVGALAASAFPKTDAEHRAAARVEDRAEPVKEAFADAGRQVKNEVADTAKDAAARTKEHATSAARDVQDDAKQSGQQLGQQVRHESG